ncbi:MAG: RnfABCDGE type electron transport complex subunit D, partial [Acutalibacteraceae bacterium]
GWLVLAAFFPSQMFSYCSPEALSKFSLSISSLADSVPSVTAVLKSGDGSKLSMIDLLLGELPGPMGASSPIVLISCGIYLVLRNSAPYQTMAGYILSAFVFAAFFNRVSGCSALCAVLFEISGGSMLFCAVFAATQRHFFPLTNGGKWTSGILLGTVTMLLRHLLPIEQTAPIAILVITYFCRYFDIFAYRFTVWSKYLRVKRRSMAKKKAEKNRSALPAENTADPDENGNS